MDVVFVVSGKCEYLEPRVADFGQDFRSLRPTSESGKVRAEEELGRDGLGRHASQSFQLQHFGTSTRLRGTQRLCQMHRCSPDAAFYPH